MCRRHLWSFVFVVTVSVAIPGGSGALPHKAHSPNPPDGATGVKSSLYLTWYAGMASTHFDIYFGTDAEAVANAAVLSPQYKGSGVYPSRYSRRAFTRA